LKSLDKRRKDTEDQYPGFKLVKTEQRSARRLLGT